MQRINVIGTSGSGKSTFAKELAKQLEINYIEMDALNWLPNWQEADPDKFFRKAYASATISTYRIHSN